MRWPHLFAVLFPLTLVGLAVAIAGNPPAVLPASAPPEVFSADRAIDDVRGLTSTGLPHPTIHYDGTPRTAAEIADHERARGYVEQRLRDLGLTPQVQRANACGKFACADVENVVARLDGIEPGPAVMLTAHYDSTPNGPGAADDGAGVATILETVRALKTGGKPRRTLIVLIDDGEEMGLLGAKAFAAEHPWAKDVGVVLNFEARGNAGQVAMFETSNDNGWLIGTFGGAVKRPVASSLIYAAYKRLPNDTDLTIYKQAGKQGLNFAFADRVYNYHTANDTAEQLDPRSLQHMGDQALSVTRALLAADSISAPVPDAVYFDLFTLTLVRYPAAATGPLALFAAALSAVALAWAVRRRRTTLRGLLRGAAVWLGALVASSLLGFALGLLFRRVRFPGIGTGPTAVRAMMGDRHALPPWLALVCLSIAVSVAFALWLSPRLPSALPLAATPAPAPPTPIDPAAEAPESADSTSAAPPAPAAPAVRAAVANDPLALAGGALILWTVFSLLLGFAAPGASYLFTLPALFAIAGLFIAANGPPSARRTTMAIALTALPAAILWFPIIRVLLIMVGVTMAPAVTVPVMLMASLVTPLLAAAPPRLRWAVPAAAATLTVVLAVMAFLR